MTDEKTKAEELAEEIKPTIAVSGELLAGINEPPVLSYADEEHEINDVLDLDAFRPALLLLREIHRMGYCDCRRDEAVLTPMVVTCEWHNLPQAIRDWAVGV